MDSNSPLELQLEDYSEGYRFRLKCNVCGYGWYENPADLLGHPETHSRMYLGEVASLLICRNCKQSNSSITPIIKLPIHHFVGGMA